MKKLAGCLKIGCFGAVVLAIALTYSGWQEKKREEHQSEQATTAAKFAAFAGAKSPPPEAIDDTPARYRRGHLLLLNAETGLVDEMFYTLPPALRAADSHDVGTEAWLRWDSHLVGKYSNGASAFQTNCDLVVYDVARKAVVAREHIEGEDPPSSVTTPRGSKAGWGKLPTEKVLKFLQDLPAR